MSHNFLLGERRADKSKNIVFCHHAGGAPLNYVKHFVKIPSLSDYNVLALSIPERPQLSLPLKARLELMCEVLEQALEPHQECVVWGHSMGSLWAYWLVNFLEQRKKLQPKALCVGSLAPGVAGLDALKGLDALSDEALFERIQQLNGMATDALSKQFFLAFLPVLRHDLRWLEDARTWSLAPLRTPLNVMWGAADPYLNKAGLKQWSVLSQNFVSQHEFSGKHFFLFEQSERVIHQVL